MFQDSSDGTIPEGVPDSSREWYPANQQVSQFCERRIPVSVIMEIPIHCPHSIRDIFPAVVEKRLIQVQQVPGKSSDRGPLLFTDGTDPVPGPFPVQCNDREYKSNTSGIGDVMRVGGTRPDPALRKNPVFPGRVCPWMNPRGTPPRELFCTLPSFSGVKTTWFMRNHAGFQEKRGNPGSLKARIFPAGLGCLLSDPSRVRPLDLYHSLISAPA